MDLDSVSNIAVLELRMPYEQIEIQNKESAQTRVQDDSTAVPEELFSIVFTYLVRVILVIIAHYTETHCICTCPWKMTKQSHWQRSCPSCPVSTKCNFLDRKQSTWFQFHSWFMCLLRAFPSSCPGLSFSWILGLWPLQCKTWCKSPCLQVSLSIRWCAGLSCLPKHDQSLLIWSNFTILLSCSFISHGSNITSTACSTAVSSGDGSSWQCRMQNNNYSK